MSASLAMARIFGEGLVAAYAYEDLFCCLSLRPGAWLGVLGLPELAEVGQYPPFGPGIFAERQHYGTELILGSSLDVIHAEDAEA